MSKIAITSDCTCDLSDKIREKYGIKLLYFYMNMDNGCFKDTEEITADNVIEYLDNGGGKVMTVAADIDEIVQFYKSMLNVYDEVIHISISSKISEAYDYALTASEQFNGKVHVVDSEQLSTGMGHLILKAAEAVEGGKSADDIVKMLEQMKQKVLTTFIMDNLDCFCRTGRICNPIKSVCNLLKIHPVIIMKKGRMRLKGIQIGDYENSAMRYVKKILRKAESMDKKRIFITHTNCKVSLISKIKQQIVSGYDFESAYVTRASATITGNCGANTVGLLYVKA